MSRIPKTASPHHETLWGLVRWDRITEQTQMAYVFSPTRRQLWIDVVELEWFGTYATCEYLRKMGWVARRFEIKEVA